MPMLRNAVLLQALLARAVLAERAYEETDPDEQVSVKELANSEDHICGGPEIWELVTKSPSVSGVQNIKWSKIDTIAQMFVKSQQAKIEVIKKNIASLTAQIEKAKEKENLRDATREEITALVTDGAKVFGDTAEAKRINCGAPGVRPRSKTAPRRAYKQCVDEFKPHALKLFQGNVKLGDAPFLEVCGQQLSCENEKATCYCDRLCQEFRDISQAVSDEKVGENTQGSGDLVRKKNELQEELSRRENDAAECKDARADLKAFADQIKELKSQANDRHQVLRDAEFALYDAEEELADIEDDLEEQQKAEAAAVATLKEAGDAWHAATVAVEKLQAEEKALTTDVSQGTAALGKARKELQDATEADKTMSGLREVVSVTILKMEMYFTAAVKEPVRNLGIEADLDLSTIFAEQPGQLTAADDVRKAVDGMVTYCKEDGQAAIDGMKAKVDLSPLCMFGTAEQIKGDIDNGVLEGMRVVKTRIEQLKSWLDPYHGMQNMNDTVAAKYVAKGEPTGLRRIMNAYGQFNFYKKYLKLWKHDGPFLKLLAVLKETAAKLQKQVEEMAANLEAIKAKLAQTATARDAAVKELEKATESRDLAAENQIKLKQVVAELQENAAKMAKDVSELEAKVKEAQEKYDWALKKIKSAHEEATSFVESTMTAAKQAELWEAVSRARAHMLSMKSQAEKAEHDYHLVAARASQADFEVIGNEALEVTGNGHFVSRHRQ